MSDKITERKGGRVFTWTTIYQHAHGNHELYRFFSAARAVLPGGYHSGAAPIVAIMTFAQQNIGYSYGRGI